MTRISAVENVTLDGVMQAPGGPDKDTRGGFEHGSWMMPFQDEVLMGEMGAGMGGDAAQTGRRRTGPHDHRQR